MKLPTEFNRNSLMGLGFLGLVIYCVFDRICETSDKALDKGMDIEVNLNDEGLALSTSHGTASIDLSEASDTPDTDIPEDTMA